METVELGERWCEPNFGYLQPDFYVPTNLPVARLPYKSLHQPSRHGLKPEVQIGCGI